MATDIQEIPEIGELTFVTAREITSHGVYVSMDEYGDMRGFLHISEIATGWVRNIYKFVDVNQKLVLKVVRTNEIRGEIDLSLRQVSGSEKKEKLISIKKADRAKAILDATRIKMNLTEDQINNYIQVIEDQLGFLYDVLEEIVRKDATAVKNLDLPDEFVSVLVEIASEKITIPSVNVRGVIDVTTKNSRGIELIRDALLAAQGVKTGGVKIAITYLGAPRYKIDVTAENYKVAEKALEIALDKVKHVIGKSKGKYSFTRE